MNVMIPLTSVTHKGVELPFPEWVFGAIALLVFAILAFVMWTYRDVSNRHSHKAAPGAANHAGAPGVSSHGTGHPGHNHS